MNEYALYQMSYNERSIMRDFYRLTTDLRAMEIDFDYAKTRKALDPNWDGYSIPKGHDIIADDVPLDNANLVTSRLQGFDLHRVLLDLDYGASLARTPNANRLTLRMRPTFVSNSLEQELCKVLDNSGIVNGRTAVRWAVGGGMVDIYTAKDLALIPSSTPDHNHLILRADMPWVKYSALLTTLASCGIIEPGYAKASIFKGYSAIRPPWVHK